MVARLPCHGHRVTREPASRGAWHHVGDDQIGIGCQGRSHLEDGNVVKFGGALVVDFRFGITGIRGDGKAQSAGTPVARRQGHTCLARDAAAPDEGTADSGVIRHQQVGQHFVSVEVAHHQPVDPRRRRREGARISDLPQDSDVVAGT